MAKIYIMNSLANALMQVKKDHPLDDGEKDVLLKTNLSELLKRIDDTEEANLKKLAITFSFNELRRIATYFSQNTYNVKKIGMVLGYAMNEKLYTQLFHSWENHPLHRELLQLLVSPGLKSFHSSELPIPITIMEVISRYITDPQMFFASVSFYVMKIQGEFVSGDFEQRYIEKGFVPKTELFLNSFVGFLGYAGKEEFIKAGFPGQMKKIFNMPVHVTLQKKMMINFLEKMHDEKNLIISFGSCFDHFYQEFGKPARKSKMCDESQLAFETYQWWYNYQIILQGFSTDSDRRRINFWEKYLTNCSVERLSGPRFLIMKFDSYVIVESEKIGTLYFYRKEIYDRIVLPELLYAKNGNLCRSWMKNNAFHSYSKTHIGQWERDVRNNLRYFNII